jgi:hypothetical protein
MLNGVMLSVIMLDVVVPRKHQIIISIWMGAMLKSFFSARFVVQGFISKDSAS